MATHAYWLLTDGEGRTGDGLGGARTWGRWVTHVAPAGELLCGYAGAGLDVPYLLDPLHDRFGPRARIWSSDALHVHRTSWHRVGSTHWTTMAEEARPSWMGSEADTRVRLRFALLAAASAVPRRAQGAALAGLQLENLALAAAEAEAFCETCQQYGLLPQAVWAAAKAIRCAASPGSGIGRLTNLVAAPYGLMAWYAAMAGESAGTALDEAAERAVAMECGQEARVAAAPPVADGRSFLLTRSEPTPLSAKRGGAPRTTTRSPAV